MRTYKFDHIENFRDIGGYPCAYGETSFGVIFRSGTLCDASYQEVDRLARMGIKSELDLREAETKKTKPSPLSRDSRFHYYDLSVNGNGRVAKDYEDFVASYLEMLEDPSTARLIFQTLLQAEKPLLIHCNAGKDRTGAFLMVLLMANGVPFEDINADYMMSYPLLTKMTANTRRYHPEVPEVVLHPCTEFLIDVKNAFLSRYGSVNLYFEAMGLSEVEAFSLSNLLGKQEKSCGAALFYQGKVLVEHMRRGHYSIPKGHVEPSDKDNFDTATREIKEETGLDVEHFLPGFCRPLTYSPTPGVSKIVYFYCAIAKEGTLIPQKEEVSDLYWLSPADAMRVLSFDSDRQIVKDAAFFEAEHNK